MPLVLLGGSFGDLGLITTLLELEIAFSLNIQAAFQLLHLLLQGVLELPVSVPKRGAKAHSVQVLLKTRQEQHKRHADAWVHLQI